YWYEVSAPTGYELPADRTSEMITIARDNAGTELTVVEFADPQVRTDISVLKVDASGQEDVPLAGATFELYRDTDGDGEAGVTDEAPDPDDELIDDCVTGADGTCTIEDLPFGTYYW